MALYYLSTWLIGALNGYSKDRLPNHLVHGTVGTVMVLAPIIEIKDLLKQFEKTPITVILATTISVGSIYFIGDRIGRGIRYIKDEEDRKPGQSKDE